MVLGLEEVGAESTYSNASDRGEWRLAKFVAQDAASDCAYRSSRHAGRGRVEFFLDLACRAETVLAV